MVCYWLHDEEEIMYPTKKGYNEQHTISYFKTAKLLKLDDIYELQLSIIMHRTINYGSYVCIKCSTLELTHCARNKDLYILRDKDLYKKIKISVFCLDLRVRKAGDQCYVMVYNFGTNFQNYSTVNHFWKCLKQC